jgi:hypothetical protein
MAPHGGSDSFHIQKLDTRVQYDDRCTATLLWVAFLAFISNNSLILGLLSIDGLTRDY